MRGLGSLYSHLLRVFSGTAVEGLPSPETLSLLLSSRTGPFFEPSMDREVSFAGGFMVDLHVQPYGKKLSELSFGHAGLMGNSFAFCDPKLGVSAAVFFNGLNVAVEDIDYLRARLVPLLIEAAADA